MSEKQALIEFHGDQILSVRTEDGIYIPMKPIVKNMGLDWTTQSNKIQSNQGCRHKPIPIQTESGIHEMICIPLKKFNGWLFSVNSNKVRIDLKEKVEQYQEECFHVLHNYWFGKKSEEIEIPKTLPEVLRAYADEVEKNIQLESKIEADKPKVEFAEHMEKTPDTISVGEFAKLLCKKGYDTGEKRLFQKFRDLKYFYKKDNKNIPYQRVIDYKWFEFNEFTKDVTLEKTGEIKKQLCQKIMVTGKGQVSISKILLRELEA